jgi:hypothetical protein
MHVQISALDHPIPIRTRSDTADRGSAYVTFYGHGPEHNRDEMVLQHNDPEYLAQMLEAAAACLRQSALTGQAQERTPAVEGAA